MNPLLLWSVFLFLCFLVQLTHSENISNCGSWTPYKDEKCIKIIERVGSQLEAIKYCNDVENKSTLITIHNKEEEDFYSNLLSKHINISENAWIGLKMTENMKRWVDNIESNYTNWINDNSPGDGDCVQMSLRSTTLGKWVEVPCDRKNLFACQRLQDWTVKTLLKVVENMNQQMTKLQQTVDSLQKNPIPLDFIYAQLPNQSLPNKIWPTVTWKDVTHEYEGLFFRAEGGNSAPFGQIQEANYSSISNARAATLSGLVFSSHNPVQEFTFKEGKWTTDLLPGYPGLYSLYFYKTNGEVRPKNTAIRFWKRV